MENASKALIIAGSVLIAILLISLGLIVFNSTSGVTGEATRLGAILEVQTYNSQFNKYFGTAVKGERVRLLCEIIISHNGQNSGNKVKINGLDDATQISAYRSTINTLNTYDVNASAFDGEGKITEITVIP